MSWNGPGAIFPSSIATNETYNLQSLNSRACGHYALLFLQALCGGTSMHEFMDKFSLHDLVANDLQAGHRILVQLPQSLQTDIVDGVENSQASCSRCEAMHH